MNEKNLARQKRVSEALKRNIKRRKNVDKVLVNETTKNNIQKNVNE